MLTNNANTDTNTYDYQDDDTLNLDDYVTPVSLSDDDVEELIAILEGDTTPIGDDDDLLNDINEALDNLDKA